MVRISKVMGHADEALVRAGGAGDLDRLGNNRADEAADFGRRRVPWRISDARRTCSGVCPRWGPVVLGLHRFFIAIARAVVNHDGEREVVLLWILWFGLSVVLLRGVGLCMRFVIGLFCLGRIWDGEWNVVAATPITCHDIELWPYSVGMLVKVVAFLATLHWPQGLVVILMWRCAFCMKLWAGERLSLEKAHPRYLRPGRPISVSAVPFGAGIDIWRSCRFIGV